MLTTKMHSNIQQLWENTMKKAPGIKKEKHAFCFNRNIFDPILILNPDGKLN
jgi:hypothetical protein